MEPKVIKLIPIEKTFSITWDITRRCNYDCMYCSPRWHNTTSKLKTLDEFKSDWLDIYKKTYYKNLKYKISISGGEATINKDFMPFIEWIKEQYGDKINKILLTTNGSASLNYYKKLYTLIDNVSFSTHSEHIDEQKFFDTVINLKKELPEDKFIHVNIMNEFWNQDRILLYQKILTEHNISHSVNEINYELQTRTFPILKGNLNLAIQ